jgi:hypothetical protein
MMKRILTIVGLLFLSLSTALATTYYFTDGGFDPANPSRRAPLAAKGDACGVSDGVGGYTGCRFILPDLKEETVAPSSSGLPINFHGYKMTTSVDFGPNEMVPVGCTDHNTCVSEYPSDDDTTYLKGTSDDEKEVYELELGDVPEGLTEPILGVTITVSSKGTAVGDTSYKFGVEQIDAATGNTVDNYGTQVTQSSTTFAQAYTTFLTNPLTGLAWTMNDVSAMKGVFTYTHVPLPGLPNPRFSAINVFVSTATAPLLSYPGTPPAGGTIDNPWCLDPASVGIRNSFEFLMDGTGTELASGDTVMLCAGNCDGTGSATYYIEPHATAHQTRGDGSVLYVAFDPKVGTTTPATTIVNIQAYPGENVTVSGDSNHDFHYTHGVDADRFWDSYESTGSTTHAGYAFSGFTVERFADRVVNTAQVDGGSTVFSDMTFQHNGAGGSAGIGDGAFVNIDGGTFQMGCTNTNAKRDGINGSVDDYAVFIFGGNKNGASLSVTYSTIRYNCELTSRTNGNCYDGSSFNSATAVELCDPATSAAGLTFDHDTIYGVFGLQNGHQGRGWTWTNNLIYDFFEGITMEENTQANVITDNSISCRGVSDGD